MLALEILEIVLYALGIGIACISALYIAKKIDDFLCFLAKEEE